MTDRLWILGAADPEMEAIEALLRECGERVTHADRRGQRVTPGDAYRADLPLCVPDVAEYIWVESDHDHAVFPDEVTERRIDHHRPGDPGYGRPPAEFLSASSIGQVLEVLGVAILFAHRDDACRVLSDMEGVHGWAYEYSGLGQLVSSGGRPYGWPIVRGGQPLDLGKTWSSPGDAGARRV
jgi:hypothetical protein